MKYVAVKSQLLGVAIREVARSIVDGGFHRGGIDNKMVREQMVEEAFRATASVEIHDMSAADFRKEVMDTVYGR